MRPRTRIRNWFRRVFTRHARATTPEFRTPHGYWNTRPILTLSPTLEDAHRRAVLWAVGHFHKRFDRHLFGVLHATRADAPALLGMGLPGAIGYVGVVSEPPFEPRVRAQLEYFYAPRANVGDPPYPIDSAQLRIRPGLDDANLLRSVTHELGHVLGLAHVRGNNDDYLMDVDGHGFELLPRECTHIRLSP